MPDASSSPEPHSMAAAYKKSFQLHEYLSSTVLRPYSQAPTASSRSFPTALATPNLKLKARKMVSFLDMPDTVRKQIYELVIYDHDRTAVFLPRALPRKVIPGIDDVDVECITCSANSSQSLNGRRPWQMPCPLRSSHDGSDPSHGIWVEDSFLVDGALEALQLPLEMAQKLSDNEVLLMIDGDSDDESDIDHVKGEDMSDILVAESVIEAEDDELMASLDSTDSDNDSEDSISSPDDELLVNLDEDEELDEEDGANDEESEEDPDVCHWDARGHCRAHTGECSDEADRSVFARADHIDVDDEEHFDSAEEVGMLYAEREPSILLVSREIRAQCLPLYYGRNAFSWRFDWSNYQRACDCFKSWAKSIDANNVTLLTKITFQGRHMIEEGCEFSADIDLLTEHPFFETNVYAGDATDAEIAQVINRELASYLWLMAQYAESRPVLSAGHLCELGSIFVQNMHR